MPEEVTRAVIERGDLAHLALFLWAASASLLALVLVRELSLSNRRFSDFVDEIARLNRRLNALRPAFNGRAEPSGATRESREI